VPSVERVGLLEREGEVAALHALVDGARAGAGGAAVVQGPAGIGKSALLVAAGDHGRDLGVPVLAARTSEFEGEVAFGLARELLAPLLDEPPAVRDAPVVPERALLVLHRRVERAAGAGGLVLLVDDAQWADGASLRFLAFSARRLATLPVALVVAVRSPVEARAHPALRELLVTERGRRLRPAPLSPGASAHLVRDRWSQDAGAGVCGAIHAASGGNPLLVHELVAAARQSGLAPTPDALPRLLDAGAAAIAPFVLDRLSRAPAGATELAEAAAVVGELDSPQEIARLAGLDEAGAADAARALVGAGVLETAAPVRFVHPLTRSAIRTAVAPQRREALARAAARRLDADGRVEAAAACVGELEPRGDAWTADVLARAAQVAQARGAPDVAATLLERALREPPPEADAAALRADLGRAQMTLGDPAAIGTLEAAFAAARAPRDRAELAAALARALFHAMRVSEAVEMLEATIAELGEDDPDLTAGLEAIVLYHAGWEASTRSAAARLTAPPADAAASPDRDVLERTRRFHRAVDAVGACRPAPEAIALLEEALAGGTLLERAPVAHSGAALLLAMAGRPDLARTHLEEAIAAAGPQGGSVMLGAAIALRGHVALIEGDVAAAARDARRGVEPDAAPHGPGRNLAWILLDALLEQDRVDEAEAVLRRYDLTGAIPDRAPLNPILHSRGRVRIAAGAVRTGLEDVLEAGTRQEALGQRNAAMVPWRVTAAEAHLALGERDAALELSAANLGLARSYGAAHVLGAALRVHGRTTGGDGGIGLLREAVGVLDGSFARLELARARTDLGEALLAAGDAAAAREALADAVTLAHDLGAVALGRRASAAALAAGARPRRVALRGAAALTPAERRVADLAARGASNQEIAEALVVTVKTVETHLSRTYHKLGIRSRTQLADALAGASDTRAAPPARHDAT